ncbi:MAG: phosphoglucomutase [Marinilabiliales bacterium]|nr:MAG: phosphoglucomutase [Marinilabiliales bacterium]
MDNQLLLEVKEKANIWLNSNINEETRAAINDMLQNDEKELVESFYKDLEFGTGGLRGIMGAGTNRMNIYTVGMATQGLSNYIKKAFPQLPEIKVAIAHDSRNNSRFFAETVAKIFSANGFVVYLFDALRPTPELSFAIRELGCQSGVVITASHNPKEYNGFKAYWEDGGQIIAPHDKNIIEEVQKIKSINDINFDGDTSKINTLDAKFDQLYIDKLKGLSLNPEVISANKDLSIVYTAIHGTGVKLVPQSLKAFGFENITTIPEQDISDGNFPTVKSPNPEETAALTMAIEKAKEKNADLVMGTDPDADRVGIAVKNDKDEFVILNGNQTAALLLDYLIGQWKSKGKLSGREYIVKTIVTSEILSKIAAHYKVEQYDVLTGFKYIADIIKKNEGKKTFIGGGEESYGYLAGEFVRDKDAVMSCALIAETASWAKHLGKTLFDQLIDIYIKYGFYKEKLISLVKKGKEGSEENQQMMVTFRNNPPKIIAGEQITHLLDYQKQESVNLVSGEKQKIDLPVSNVLQFITEKETKISVRPSGTEPKIKFYISVNTELTKRTEYSETNRKLEEKLDNIAKEIVNF